MERNDKCFCNSGLKYKKCHVHINAESKIAHLYKANAAFTLACQEKEIVNNCPPNCCECCKDFFFIDELEFFMILQELIHNNKDLTIYQKKAKEILRHIEDEYPEVMKRIKTYMPKTMNPEDCKEFYDDIFHLNSLPYCIFLDENQKCSIYEVRPSVCRGYGTTEKCRVLKNENIEMQEKKNLYINLVISNKLEEGITKRPYPIFYWFAHFLDSTHYSLTIEKMKKATNCSEKQYYEYTKSLL